MAETKSSTKEALCVLKAHKGKKGIFFPTQNNFFKHVSWPGVAEGDIKGAHTDTTLASHLLQSHLGEEMAWADRCCGQNLWQ